MTTVLKNQRGLFHLPMAVILVCIAVAGFGIWGFLRNWRHLAETQLRLDRCVAEVSHGLKDQLNELDRSNGRIRALRAAIVGATVLQPQTIPGLRAALRAMALLQDVSLARWEIRRVQWLASGGCGSGGDHAPSLPPLGLSRDPDDLIGPKPLRGSVTEYRIVADHVSRHAAARVFKETTNGKWTERWAPPGPIAIRASLR